MSLHPYQQAALDDIRRRVAVSARRGKWMHHPSWNGLHILPEPDDMPYFGPDLFDVAPPGIHALLAYRNVHRNTGILDGTSLAVQD